MLSANVHIYLLELLMAKIVKIKKEKQEKASPEATQTTKAMAKVWLVTCHYWKTIYNIIKKIYYLQPAVQIQIYGHVMQSNWQLQKCFDILWAKIKYSIITLQSKPFLWLHDKIQEEHVSGIEFSKRLCHIELQKQQHNATSQEVCY